MTARIRRFDELDEGKSVKERGKDFELLGGIDVKVGREDVALEVRVSNEVV